MKIIKLDQVVRDPSKRKILIIALPAIGEMVLHMMVGVVDIAMLSRLGPDSLSAGALGSQILFFALFVFSALGVGGAALVARHIGGNQREEASMVAGQAIMIAFFLGVALTFLGYWGAPNLFRWFSLTKPVERLAITYLQTVSLCVAPVLIYFVLNAILRGAGNTLTPLKVTIVVNSLNVVGDYALIFGRLGLPALGVQGAAIATAGAMVVGFVLTLMAVVFFDVGIDLKKRHCFPLDWTQIIRIIKLSLPAGIEELLRNSASLLGSYMIVSLGTLQFAAHQVALSIESLSFMPGYGFAIAATTLVGQALGRKDSSEAEALGWKTAQMAVVVMGSLGMVFLIFPWTIVTLYTGGGPTTPLAVACIRIAAFEQVTIALEMVLAGSLRGAGDTKSSMIIAGIGNWLLRIPLLYVVVYVLELNIYYVWLVTVIDWLVRALLVSYRFRTGKWKRLKI